MDTGSLDRLRTVIGVLDENLMTIARELSLSTRIDGTKIILTGEEADVGGTVVMNLLAVADAGENIDKARFYTAFPLPARARRGISAPF